MKIKSHKMTPEQRPETVFLVLALWIVTVIVVTVNVIAGWAGLG